jgi:NTP pyrophosphatase (non-canonical NTP hydrolase)
MSMSNSQKERRARREREDRERWGSQERENARLASLTMGERIEVSDASSSVKELLHMLAEAAGLET